MTNKFDANFERIEKAFRKQAEIKARQEAKTEALAMAMNAHADEKKLLATQGSDIGERLNKQGNEKKPLFNWRQKMNTLNSKFGYSLMGGASIAVLAMVVVAPNLIDGANLPSITNEETAQTRSGAKSPQDGAVVSEPLQVSPQPEIATSQKPLILEQSSQPQADFMERQQSGSALAKRNAPTALSLNNVQMSKKRTTSPSRVRVMPQPDVLPPRIESNDKFEKTGQNPIKSVREEPVSTFSADVDTASYSYLRSAINNNDLPSPDSLRIEELINYFDYDYEVPANTSRPFKANIEIMPTPWNEGTKLMSIGVKGYEIENLEQPASNLVFLIDTSGSMNQANKLPLLRSSFKLLLDTLKPEDTVSIVTYAGSAGTALEPTKAKDRAKILGALDRLSAGGSTAGQAGIRQAYSLAQENFAKDGVSRVILATDGDFNVGISDPEALQTYIEKKRESGVTLSVLGFGRGNYNDALMQKLAQNGNGNASYIDTLSEARKVLVEEVGSTLFTIAKDVKLQVEFNPALVSEYRLIGYETRALKREDFNNDKVDAGDIGSGHTVTALYEITPVGSPAARLDELRYASDEESNKPADNSGEYGFLKIRYKAPNADTSKLIETPITNDLEVNNIASASQNARFATSVAAFGELLKGGKYTQDFKFNDVIALAQSAKGADPFGYRSEFIKLVRDAETIASLERR